MFRFKSSESVKVLFKYMQRDPVEWLNVLQRRIYNDENGIFYFGFVFLSCIMFDSTAACSYCCFVSVILLCFMLVLNASLFLSTFLK